MANFHQKSVNVVLLWFVFVSVGITPLFGGMRRFYSFYLSKLGCHQLKSIRQGLVWRFFYWDSIPDFSLFPFFR
uniref:Uncharacterized protein n=1 Tax=Chlorella vulgaris TaxID=3077 RepID=V9H0S0_CHLVU|nr:hypothetical protein ChvulCp057 [Chlorella vulgaris]pir/T07244/ hypothetical protein 73a - Chlorella vulgaris chloroplast [Chlorella vulgaris]QSV10858.1 hypothetical protein [Chlorella vulgaris]BAA57891.1 unnamed protein product [Chlorella vulgaris]